ncbi:hypothetical protein O181_054984 [Austropuccinia psidii MF-1]|uniref:Uncharacterized protein n=1 Tax=Austropuccinia psidii MF-1 TaxID=1389203 RepID=A0A9Q3E5M3_9BASI|nr:hypothetical protein [Austropuccinia psidii MF-1]
MRRSAASTSCGVCYTQRHTDPCYLARHSMKPTAKHWFLLDHVVGYLLKTRSHGICLLPTSLALSLWSDAGWGWDLKRSQSGFILKLGDAPIH